MNFQTTDDSVNIICLNGPRFDLVNQTLWGAADVDTLGENRIGKTEMTIAREVGDEVRDVGNKKGDLIVLDCVVVFECVALELSAGGHLVLEGVWSLGVFADFCAC